MDKQAEIAKKQLDLMEEQYKVTEDLAKRLDIIMQWEPMDVIMRSSRRCLHL